MNTDLPEGVTDDVRGEGEQEVIYVTSFWRETRMVELGRTHYVDRISGRRLTGSVNLPPYGVLVLDRTK